MTERITEVQGQVQLRPLILGVVLDTSDPGQVSHYMLKLSRLWGGFLSMLLDPRGGTAQLMGFARAGDVDALWLAEDDPELSSLAASSHLLWRGGRGDLSPFASPEYSEGALPWDVVAGRDPHGPVPADPLVEWLTSASASPLLECWPTTAPSAVSIRAENVDEPVVVLMNRSDISHQVQAWNLRSTARRTLLVDGRQVASLDWELATQWLHHGPAENVPASVTLWNLAKQDQHVWSRLESAAEAAGSRFQAISDDALVTHLRTSVRTPFRERFTVRAPYGASRLEIPLPRITPLGGGTPAPGFRQVAAEISFDRIVQADPRLTARLPDDPRFGEVLESRHAGRRMFRPSEDGLVLSVDATSQQVDVFLHRKNDVFQLMFNPADPSQVTVRQSDAGLFQSRVAEKLGGVAAAALTQPGLAGAIELLSTSANGAPWQHVRNVIRDHRGSFPEILARQSEDEYVNGLVNALFNSGLVRTHLNAQCGYCAATIVLPAESIAEVITCDFCAQDIRLAALTSRRSASWRYRLAGHLSPSQVEAMIPVLAAMGQISTFATWEGAADLHELGLMLEIDRRSIEVDIAAYYPYPANVLILGEVKKGNRIDEKDVRNLEFLQNVLDENDFPSVLLFATAKDEFGSEELDLLRDHCASRAQRLSLWNREIPRLPLVLTRQNLFAARSDEDNIFSWKSDQSLGPHGKALVSCQRNLGLTDWTFRDGQPVADLLWEQPAE